MPKYTIQVNGKIQSVEVDADTPLLWVLRDELKLYGSKYGCGISQCGACTVHLNGRAMRSCALPISTIDGQKITTIEGLSKNIDHPLQNAWRDHDVPQCGYCQAGQIMQAASLLNEKPNPTSDEIDLAMKGNLCRCGTYLRVKAAIQSASKNL